MDGKNFIILRGLPGMGKSTYAKNRKSTLIVNALQAGSDRAHAANTICRIHSTDDYFGETGFNAEEIEQAHAWNYKRFTMSVRQNVRTIILDNTNIRRIHFDHYADYAEIHKYEVQEIVIGTFDEFAIQLAYSRNIHGVPLETIRRMADSFEP